MDPGPQVVVVPIAIHARFDRKHGTFQQSQEFTPIIAAVAVEYGCKFVPGLLVWMRLRSAREIGGVVGTDYVFWLVAVHICEGDAAHELIHSASSPFRCAERWYGLDSISLKCTRCCHAFGATVRCVKALLGGGGVRRVKHTDESMAVESLPIQLSVVTACRGTSPPKLVSLILPVNRIVLVLVRCGYLHFLDTGIPCRGRREEDIVIDSKLRCPEEGKQFLAGAHVLGAYEASM